MTKENDIWTCLTINKETNEELSFAIWKNGNKMEFTPEEAIITFPKAMNKHRQGLIMYNICEGGRYEADR